MHESLWRWWCLWWCLCLAAPLVMVVATAGQSHCEVLDLTLQPSPYPLPTNLTLRPSVTEWSLNFTLQEGKAPPAACVRLKETESKVQLILYEGDCVNGSVNQYSYLKLDLLTPHAWTTLALDVKNNVVFVTPPDNDTISLKANISSLARYTMQVTWAQDVEAAVGCHVNCPLYSHASEGSQVKKKVREWYHDKLQFYIRPGSAFDKLHYEVSCSKRQDSFRSDVVINPGQDDTVGAWRLVKLEQQDRKVVVYLNNKLMEKIQLPDSCATTMHVMWMIGDASFGFNCVPNEVVQQQQQQQRDPGGEEQPVQPVQPVQPERYMHTWVAVGIGIIVLLLVQALIGISIYLYIGYRRRSKTHDARQTNPQTLPTNISQNPPSQNGEAPQTNTQTPATNKDQTPLPGGEESQKTLPPRTIKTNQQEKLKRHFTWGPGTQPTHLPLSEIFTDRRDTKNVTPNSPTTDSLVSHSRQQRLKSSFKEFKRRSSISESSSPEEEDHLIPQVMQSSCTKRSRKKSICKSDPPEEPTIPEDSTDEM